MSERDTVVTINTWKGEGAYRERLASLVEGLAELWPSVVALQESFVCAEGGADTARTLASALGMHLAFAPARRKPRLFQGAMRDSISGMALLSAREWTEAAAVRLPFDDRDGERVALIGRTSVCGGEVVVANVHLTHLRDADDLRVAQLARLFAHPLLSDADQPVLVCGDFNSAEAERLVRSALHGTGRTAVDAWQVSGATGSRGSVANGACLDYIFSVAPEGRGHPPFEESAVVLDRPGSNGVCLSDHAGVMTRRVGGFAHA